MASRKTGKGVNEMQISRRQTAFAALLIAVSILAIQPGVTQATPNQQGTVSINASGQATPIGNRDGKDKNNGSPTSAVLTLTGNARFDGNNLEIGGISGSLQIGATNYTLSGGQGGGNKGGKLEIQTKTNGRKGMELVLHGSMQGSNVVFTNPQSKLASLYFLSLSGQITINVNTSSTSRSSRTEDEGEGHTLTVTQTTTVTQNNTVVQTQSNTETQNVTVTQTKTLTQNNTETVTGQNQTLTVTHSVNITITHTITQPQNVTITVTQTGTNSTITQTVTTASNSTTTESVTVTQNVTVTKT
jgi:hypothetical protein